MPGLKLTEAQARRLWDLDGDTCNLALTTLEPISQMPKRHGETDVY